MEELANEEVKPTPGLALVTITHPELESASDVDLVLHMSCKNTSDDIAMARWACEQLHHRHARLLLAFCLKERMETFGQASEALVNQTFFQAYEQADKFNCESGSEETNYVLAWLFRIMRNLYLDARKHEGIEPFIRFTNTEPPDFEDLEDNRDKAVQQVPTLKKVAMIAFLETLSNQDHEILIVTSEYWDPERKEVVLDPSVRKSLCSEFGLTESSLRVRRKRLKDAAIKFVENYLNQTNT